MKYQTLIAAFIATATFAGMTPAQAQTPSIATTWGNMNIPQDRCLARSRIIFEDLKCKRIETIGVDTFADFERFQVAIRCVSEKQLFYVFGGGPSDGDKQLIRIMDTIKAEFLK